MAAGLGCSPFARHYLGNHCCFLFLLLLRCFSSEGMPPRLPGALSGCPIRKSADHSSYATPHSLSQLYTSFIASACLGIHRVPLYASFIRLARPVGPRTGTHIWFYCGPDGDEPHLATLGVARTMPHAPYYALRRKQHRTLFLQCYFFTMSKNSAPGAVRACR